MPSQMTNSSQRSQNSQDSSSDSMYRSPTLRKEVLRNKFINAQALQNNVNTGTLKNLEQIITEVDEINLEGTIDEKIKDQGEVLLDSEIMTISSNVLKECTYSLSKNISSYDPSEFAVNIKTYLCQLPDTVALGSDDPDWTLLGKEVMQYFKRTPQFSMILGTLKPIAKKEIIKKTRNARDPQAPTKRPENVVVLEKVEDSVEQIIFEIHKIIRHYQKEHKKPLDFFSLVLHPTDFGKTIENILHVSFLVRDGHVKFITDEDGIPYVQKASKEEVAESERNKNRRNVQNVLSLKKAQWEALVEAYKIEKPMIDFNLSNQKAKQKSNI